ncbi:hypothetical protein [Halobacterium salinarum]|uniref:hypothetical protein n=1 Tax=Halobacterium salinarum TaxID=2242 RepID=UPI002556F64F|nr:hypothetical protein [Halobacterium salinarum]MDL0134055.1 hypothetical protein [Halobacterium salinarum]
MNTTPSPGDEWPGYYRGYRLQTNPDGDVWWQVYNGTERLYVEPTPDDLVENLLARKRLGGRVRVTEDNAVITRVEDGDDYEDIYVGDLDLSGKLVPEDQTEYSVDIQPEGLTSGDLWPSVYDGAKYSFSENRVWWQHPQTHKRHPVETDLPSSILSTLQRLKPTGGSFRVTPWNDVITLVEDPPNPDQVREQLHELPRVIKNIIVLRRERGVERLPLYIGSLDTVPLEVSEPRSLTDALSPEERAQLDAWSGSLGQTEEIDPDDHRIDDAGDTPPKDDPADW